MGKHRILIVKIGAIGDVIMTLPLLQEIRRKYPAAKVDWLVGKKALPFLEEVVGIERLYSIDDSKLLLGSRLAKALEVLKTWFKIGGKKYDQIYLAHTDPRYRYLTLITFGVKKKLEITPGRYHGDEYVRMAGAQAGPFSFPEIKSSKSLASYLEDLGSRFVILAPGGDPKVEPGKELRMWPITYFVELARKLVLAGFKVVLVGGPSDAWVLDFFEKEDKIISLIGSTSLCDLPHLMHKAAAVATHDSGLMHMAVFAKAPLVAIFGPTIPQEKLPLAHAEYRSRIRLHWAGEDLTCRPCYNGKHYAPCSLPLCMRASSPQTIYQSICELVHEKNCARA